MYKINIRVKVGDKRKMKNKKLKKLKKNIKVKIYTTTVSVIYYI